MRYYSLIWVSSVVALRLGKYLYHTQHKLSRAKQNIFVPIQRKEQYQAENAAGDYLSGSHGQHKIRYRTLKLIDIGKNKGNDQRIGNNGGQRYQEFIYGTFFLRFQSAPGGTDGFTAYSADGVCAQCTDQRCEAAENRIQDVPHPRTVRAQPPE